MSDPATSQPEFLGGVVEGFYGQPWNEPQRFELFDWMTQWGLNAYFYAPKDDLKHRAIWRERYTGEEARTFARRIDLCRERGIRLIYGLSPGLDIRFADPAERELIESRFQQLVDLGCTHFALLFDDLPGEIQTGDREMYDSVAAAQSDVTNRVHAWLRDQIPESRLLFCPTPYCDRMDRAGHGGNGYLEAIGASLDETIDIFWTGPEIVAREIPLDSIRRLAERIRRPPVIWDNLHANDYDVRRLYCGPYSGRPVELREHVRGIFVNPNNEFPINYVPLRTFAKFLAAETKDDYRPESEYREALADWTKLHETVGRPIDPAGLKLLADCYYLPFALGSEAEKLVEVCRYLIRQPVADWGDRHSTFLTYRKAVQETFDRLTELVRRDLFHAWSRRVWDLNEELQLLEGFFAKKQAGEGDAGEAGVLLETHLAGTYRGGVVADLQRLTEMDASGRVRPTLAVAQAGDKR